MIVVGLVASTPIDDFLAKTTRPALLTRASIV